MNSIPVVFTFDKRIFLAASVAIKSLINSANPNTTYDIKILHSNIELKYQKDLTDLVKNTNHNISFYYINPEIFKGLKKSKNSWTEIVYYRLIIPEIVCNYDKVIYSDVDVFFKKDLTEIYNTDITDYEAAAVKAEKNTPETICHKYFPQNKNEFIFWSGFLLINSKKLKKENYMEKFINTAKTYNDELKFYDLDVLNITLNKILPLPLNYCTLEAIYEFYDITKVKDYAYLKNVYSLNELEDAKNNPAIIHYAGELGKPWHRKKPPKYYQELIATIPKNLKKTTFRTFRKKLFSKI